MNDFLLIFRRDFQTPETQPPQEQMKAHLQQWSEWFDQLAAEDVLARPYQRWDGDGRVLKAGKNITNGPYAEIKESIGGLVIIRAESYEQALEIAQGSPILKVGGSVEIRMGF
jgi:hypothetical protein